MFKKVNDLKEKVSDKFLVGAIALEAFLGNSPLASAQGTGDKAASSPDNVIGAIGLAIGGMLYVGGKMLDRDGHENTGRLLKNSSYFVFGATAGAYFF